MKITKKKGIIIVISLIIFVSIGILIAWDYYVENNLRTEFEKIAIQNGVNPELLKIYKFPDQFFFEIVRKSGKTALEDVKKLIFGYHEFDYRVESDFPGIRNIQGLEEKYKFKRGPLRSDTWLVIHYHNYNFGNVPKELVAEWFGVMYGIGNGIYYNYTLDPENPVPDF